MVYDEYRGGGRKKGRGGLGGAAPDGHNCPIQVTKACEVSSQLTAAEAPPKRSMQIQVLGAQRLVNTDRD